ncbi:hypothetical protein D3C75_1189830 [compost metagenome]
MIDKMPANMMMMAITHANMGRSIKNLAMSYRLLFMTSSRVQTQSVACYQLLALSPERQA